MQVCGDLLVELQVEYEGCTKGFYQEAALGQMDGLKESEGRGRRKKCVNTIEGINTVKKMTAAVNN